MAWVNLASTRYVARAEAEFCFGPESTTTKSMHVSGEIRAALLAGEPSRLEGHANAYRDWLRWKTEGGKPPDAGTLADPCSSGRCRHHGDTSPVAMTWPTSALRVAVQMRK